MSRILLFLSTGRCGTQFLTEVLAASAASRADVSHEPLGARYCPRQCLRMADPAQWLGKLPEVAAHFDHWEAQLQRGVAVVETGWPVFPWIPYLWERFRDRLDVIHLTRDPVRFAFSMASHDYYSPRRDDEFTRFGALLPTDAGTVHPEYVGLWPTLNRVERCLFQWAEINAFAETLAAQGMVTRRIAAEHLFAEPLRHLEELRALHPVWREVLAEPLAQAACVDRFHSQIHEPVRGLRYTRAIADLAARLGYAVDLEAQRGQLVDRFFASAATKA